MIRRFTTIALSAVALGLVATPASAQSGGLEVLEVNEDDYPTLEVTVAVPEQLEGTLLSKQAFAVRENDGDWTRPYLGNSPDSDEPVPPQAVLVFDTSGSMLQDIDRARDAADAFVSAVPTGTEIAVVTFGDEAETIVPFTDDLDEIRSRIASIEVDSQASTALFDGVLRATSLLPGNSDAAQGLVLLSDGGDRASTNGQDDVTRDLAERDATLWAIALATDESDADTLEALVGERGEVFDAGDAEELEGIYRGLASDLSRRYVLRYETQATGETDIEVALAWNTVNGQAETTTELEGVPRDEPATTQVANAEPFTVTVPLLASSRAYALSAIAALAVASFIFWLFVLSPRPVRTRDRLLSGHTVENSRRRLSAIAEWTTDATERRLRKSRFGAVLDRVLEQAGLELRPGELVVLVVSLMVVAYTAGLIAANALLGLLVATAVPLAARLWLSIRRDRRQTAFSEQLTDVLQLITGSLRAGYGLVQGIDAVSRDAEEPAASEFRRIIIEHRLGRDLHEGMHNCAIRMDNDDFAWVVQAIGIHRDVGGDLARVLDNIVDTVRDRGDVHREVRTLSAEGKMSAVVLTALPFVVLGGLQLMNPGYLNDFISRPIGWILLASAGVSMLIGSLVIRRLVRIRY